MSVYCILHFVLLSCRVSSAPLSKLRLNSPSNTLKRYFILSLLVCVLFPTVHSPSWCSAGPCWSYLYISVWQNRKIVRLVWVFQILRSQTRENVRKWHSSMRLFLNVSHFARVLSLSKFLYWILQRRLSVSTFFCNICCVYLYFFSFCFLGTLQLELLPWKIPQEANPLFRNQRARGTHAFQFHGFRGSIPRIIVTSFPLLPIHVDNTFLSKSQSWDPDLENSGLAGITEVCS